MAQAPHHRTVGVLGTKDVGLAIARGCILKGETVIMGTRDPKEQGKHDKLFKALTEGAADEHDKKALEKILHDKKDVFHLDTFENAAHKSTVLFLCVGWEAVKDVSKDIQKNAEGKVLFDLTNPLDYSQKPPVLSVCGNNSAGEVVQNLLPKTHVIKCWNYIGNRYFCNGSRDDLGGNATMFYCGNDANSKKIAVEYANAWHWKDHLDCGDITKSRYLEPLAMLWIDHLFQTGFGFTHAFTLLRTGKSREKST